MSKGSDYNLYCTAVDQPHWIQGLQVLNNRAICDRCGDIQPRFSTLTVIDKWNSYHFSRTCILHKLSDCKMRLMDAEEIIDWFRGMARCNEYRNKYPKETI